MSGDRVERRLAAILAADVAGYSRLMEADEEDTLARVKAHRRGFTRLRRAAWLPRPCELRLPTSGPVRQNEVCTTLRWREMDSNFRFRARGAIAI
jgi:hypothetical protein